MAENLKYATFGSDTALFQLWYTRLSYTDTPDSFMGEDQCCQAGPFYEPVPILPEVPFDVVLPIQSRAQLRVAEDYLR